MELDERFESLRSRLNDAVETGGIASAKAKELEAKMLTLGEAHRTTLVVEKLWQQVRDERNKPQPNSAVIKRLEEQMTRVAADFVRKGKPLPGLPYKDQYNYDQLDVLGFPTPTNPDDQEALEQRIGTAKDYAKSRKIEPSEAERVFEAGISGFKPETQEQKRRAFQGRTQTSP